MNYDQALEYLQNLTSLGWKLGLDKIRSLLKEIDNPHEKYKVVHVAGTNGKGSTSSMLASILEAAGYKTGLFTSPHLFYVGERIKYNGIPISQNELVEYIKRLQPLIKKYKTTFFESITAIGLLYFADKKVDIAVVEVGLGGRLDATNVVNSILSIITNINIDHTKQLGSDLKSIAKEKAGIIKQNSICISNSDYKSVNSVFEQFCRERQTEHISITQLININNVKFMEKFTSLDLAVNGTYYPDLKLSLIGEHQVQNGALAVTAANILNEKFLPIKADHIYEGLSRVQWEGRLQTLSLNPKIVVDVAHNPNGISFLKKSIRTIYNYERLIVVMGIAKDKLYEDMVKQIAPLADLFIAVKSNNRRSLSATILGNAAKKHTENVVKCQTVQKGLHIALQKTNKNDMILCTGSHYTVGEFITCLNNGR
ncbi:bifunctional folylpolyglutamate synthase/dihydrofolate synthase [candidate division KSB1 bacterium]|nr:bifunctional folylpolyglutamate synthase/dihydrofolate synthase [candidate division KSB1 bacterium]